MRGYICKRYKRIQFCTNTCTFLSVCLSEKRAQRAFKKPTQRTTTGTKGTVHKRCRRAAATATLTLAARELTESSLQRTVSQLTER